MPMAMGLVLEEHLEAGGFAPATIREYRRRADHLDRWLDRCGLAPDDMKPLDVQRWCRQHPHSYATRSLLRATLRHLGTCGLVDQALADAVKLPPQPAPSPKPLTPVQARQIEAEAHRWGREGTAVLLGLYLAMRRSEIASAAWAGWDAAAGTWTWQAPKTGRRVTLPVHARLTPRLREWRRQVEGPWVFPGTMGRHVAPVTVSGWVRRVSDSAGVKCSPHQLRHTALTTAYSATKDIRAVQAMAGHSSPGITAGYVGLAQEQLRRVVDGLDYAS